MNDLIKLTEQNGKVAVSARELYSFLDVNTKFSEWANQFISSQIIKGFVVYPCTPYFYVIKTTGREVTPAMSSQSKSKSQFQVVIFKSVQR